MFPYVEEQFTPDEEVILRRYVTNLHLPVFALVNLPEVVKGALFARYSRSPKSLRRLFLDEFVGDLDISGDISLDATIGLARAEQLYEKVFVEYGDDSVAQLGGVHLACEQSSNVLSKVLEWGRLMSYLEQSTRYIAYDNRLDSGHYRYFRPIEILDSPFGARYVGDMDRVFDTYGALMPAMRNWVADRFPQQAGDSDFVYRQAVKAKSLDALRGLLPAASLSNIGLYGTGQSYEQLLLRMRAHPLPEARTYADLMLTELRKVIPSFLQRVDVAERGGEWTSYLTSTRHATARVVERLWPDEGASALSVGESEPEVTLLDFDPDGEEKVLAAACFSHLRMLRTRGSGPGPTAQPQRTGGLIGGLCRRSTQPSASTGTRLRAHRLPLRIGDGLWRVSRSATTPDADDRMAATRYQPRLRHARDCGRSRTGRWLHRGDRTGRRSLSHVGPHLPRASGVRRRPRTSDPLRDAVQRARSHASHRAPVGQPRSPRVPTCCATDASSNR